MRIANGVFLALAGLALSSAGAAAQEYGYYRYFGPGPYDPGVYGYAPPPAYYVPPPPRYYYPPQPFYSYAEPEYPYAYAPPPPLPPGGYRQPLRQPVPGYAPPPLPRKRETPPATATARPKDKTASVAAPSRPVSCTKAEETVSSYGFGNVKPVTCAGKLYDFAALRDGKKYRVQVSAATGEITEVRKQP
jgi:hypothetical protein